MIICGLRREIECHQKLEKHSTLRGVNGVSDVKRALDCCCPLVSNFRSRATCFTWPMENFHSRSGGDTQFAWTQARKLIIFYLSELAAKRVFRHTRCSLARHTQRRAHLRNANCRFWPRTSREIECTHDDHLLLSSEEATI